MKLALYSRSLPGSGQRGPLAVLDKIARLGFDGCLFASPFELSPRLEPTELQAVRAHADSLGVHLDVGLGQIHPLHFDERPDLRALGDGDMRSALVRVARAMSAIGCTDLMFIIGTVDDRFNDTTPWNAQLQISADRFVKTVRVYVVKNRDGTQRRDPARIVMDVIVEQRLLPKGRKRDDLRLQYDVSAARVHLQAITHLLKSAHGGQVPVVPYDPSYPKAEQLGAERYLFQWNARHLSPQTVNNLIRLVLHGVVFDRSVWRADRRDQPSAAPCWGDRAAPAVRGMSGGKTSAAQAARS